jgi:hypothetical protein
MRPFLNSHKTQIALVFVSLIATSVRADSFTALKLKSWTAVEAQKIADRSADIMIRYQGTETDKYPADFHMPWLIVQDNCTRRASLTNHAIASVQYDFSIPATKTILERSVKNASSSGQIHMSAPLSGFANIVDADGKTVVEGGYAWTNHVAALINVEGQARVLDLSLSKTPVTVGEWTRAYLKPGIQCAVVDKDAYAKVLWYYTVKDQFPTLAPKPAIPCAIKFSKAFDADNAQEPLSAKTLEATLEDAAIPLRNDFEILKTQLEEMRGIPESEFKNLKVQIIPADLLTPAP